MVLRVVGRVELHDYGQKLVVHVIAHDLVDQAVRVCHDHCDVLAAEARHHCLVVEPIHEELRMVQNIDARIDGSIEYHLSLAHGHNGKVRSHLHEPVVVGLRALLQEGLLVPDHVSVDMLTRVLVGLPVDRVVPQLEEVLLEVCQPRA